MPQPPPGDRLVSILQSVLDVRSPVLRGGDDDALTEVGVTETGQESGYVVEIESSSGLPILTLDGDEVAGVSLPRD